MFEVLKQEKSARRGRFTCPHGVVETPVFMNVGTAAAIKGGLDSEDLKELGCQIELSNTYHLHVRPGDDVIYEMGGVRAFMNWQGGRHRQRRFSGIFAREASKDKGGGRVI